MTNEEKLTDPNRRIVNFAKGTSTFGLFLFVLSFVLERTGMEVFYMELAALVLVFGAKPVILIYSKRKKERRSAIFTLGFFLLMLMLIFVLVYIY